MLRRLAIFVLLTVLAVLGLAGCSSEPQMRSKGVNRIGSVSVNEASGTAPHVGYTIHGYTNHISVKQ